MKMEFNYIDKLISNINKIINKIITCCVILSAAIFIYRLIVLLHEKD